MALFPSIKEFALDTLFPISCLVCGQGDVWLCDRCLEKIPLKNDQVCPICEKNITPLGQTCFSCRKKYSLDGLLVSFSYQQEPVAHLIHLYKYRFAEGLHLPLGKMLVKALLDHQLPIPDLLIPVPLHPKRLRWRGFNQAGLLACHLGENLAPGFPIPVPDHLLVRRKNTTTQMEIKNYSQRQKNMRDAFSINANFHTFSPRVRGDLPEVATSLQAGVPEGQRGRSVIAGKNILLVDDVATTGSTLFECAKILKKSGAASVFGIVIARQEFKKK